MLVIAATAVASLVYVRHLHHKELPLVARQLGFRSRHGRYERPIGRAIARFQSASATSFVLELDLTEMVGTRLGIRRRTFGSKPVVTGEPLLDHDFEIVDPIAACAFLAPHAQIVAMTFADAGANQSLVCEHGVFVLRSTQSDVVSDVEGWLTRFQILVRALEADGAGIDVRLRRNALADSPGLRLRSLQLIEHAFPGSASHQASIQDGLLDTDPAVRIEAARQGRRAEVLREVVRDRNLASHLRVLAIGAHGEVASEQTHSTLLEDSVTDADETVSLLAINSLKSRGSATLGRRFVRLLDVVKGERRRALLDALNRLGDASLESTLLEHWKIFNDEERRLVCTALARWGTVESVPKLRRWLSEGWSKAWTSEAEHAIAAIQRRVHGGEAGQVSLASDGGEVSLPEGAGGSRRPVS